MFMCSIYFESFSDELGSLGASWNVVPSPIPTITALNGIPERATNYCVVSFISLQNPSVTIITRL